MTASLVSVSKPGVYLWRMIIFLMLIGFLCFILYEQIYTAFLANPGLNGLIVASLVIGILYSSRQVIRLYPEIHWINQFRFTDPGNVPSRSPQLLASMANMLRNQTGPLNLSTNVTTSILDSVGSRMDEGRDTSRYLIGLLIFLGLLGTFWGLLDTIQSVGKTISSLDTSGNDNIGVFQSLKEGLQAPLKGMGTAFSSSLFGLAGSLVLGFLDLQANQAQNRFYHELEEWLASMTSVGEGASSGDSGKMVHAAMSEIHQNLNAVCDRLERMLRQEGTGGSAVDSQLSKNIEQLVGQMRAEQNIVRQWVDEQAATNGEIREVLVQLSKSRG